MNKKLSSLTLLSGIFAISTQAAVLSWTGVSQSADLGTNDWVVGTKMWESVNTGSASATGNVGFSSIDLSGPNTFTWTFGDLELTSFQSPGPATPGFEVYSEGDASVQDFIMTYNGTDVVSGTVQFLRVDVSDVNDITAVGNAEVVLNSSLGPDPSIFNEFMALTNSTGFITIDIFNFNPVDAFGQFSSTGELTAVPEPSTYATLFGLIAFLLLRFRKRVKN
jgi:hypothetical protein